MSDMITREVGGLAIQAWPAATSHDAPRHISVGAFFDRFGALKWSILASSDASVRAVIADASVRKFIDLDNPQLPAGLSIIEVAGFDIDADAILVDEIQPGERP